MIHYRHNQFKHILVGNKGRRKAKRIGKDKRIAMDAAKKIEAKLVLGDLDLERINSRCPTFREHAELWLSLPNDRKESTTENYVRTLSRHIYPAFGDM